MKTKSLITLFLTWRVLLLVFLFFAVQILPLRTNFLGGDPSNYLQMPYLWSWLNFDGVHYLSVAFIGYQPLTYFYFPAYPLIVHFLGSIVGGNFLSYVYSGLFISHAAFLIGLFGLIRLIKLDYSDGIVKTTLWLLFLFPTSFYFGSFYTESLFFALCVWSFYFMRKKRWIFAGLIGAVATITRVVGLALIPAFMVEFLIQRKEQKFFDKEALIGLLLVPVGIAIYSAFLWRTTGDPFDFFNSVGIFGQQRASGFVPLPQVFYRYFFKILPNINYGYFPVVFSTYLELLVASLFLVLIFALFTKSRLSYALFSLASYLIPTFSGSFSSLPRYVLIIFPAFILVASYVSKLPTKVQFLIFLFLATCLIVSTSLFVRGYWIS